MMFEDITLERTGSILMDLKEEDTDYIDPSIIVEEDEAEEDYPDGFFAD